MKSAALGKFYVTMQNEEVGTSNGWMKGPLKFDRKRKS